MKHFLDLGPVSQWSRKVFKPEKPQQNLKSYDNSYWPFCLRFADSFHVHTYVPMLSELALVFAQAKHLGFETKTKMVLEDLGKGTV